MVQAICSHSPMSQNLPTRFQTSAAGRLTAISRGMAVYVGEATAGPVAACGVGGAGVCAVATPKKPAIASAQPALIVLSRFLIEFSRDAVVPFVGFSHRT